MPETAPEAISEAERYAVLAAELHLELAEEKKAAGEILEAADYYIKSGHRDKSEELYQKGATEAKTDYEKAVCLKHLGNTTEARQKFKRALEVELARVSPGRKEDDSYAGRYVFAEKPQGDWLKIGRIYRELGDTISVRAAADMATEILVADDNYLEAAVIWEELGDQEKAKEAYNRVTNNYFPQETSEERKYYGRGLAYEKLGYPEKAKEEYEKALKEIITGKNPEFRSKIYEDLARVYGGGKVPTVEKGEIQKREIKVSEQYVEFDGVKREVCTDIREPDLVPVIELLETPTTVKHLRDMAMAAESPRHPVLLIGPTGTGKSSFVGYYSKLLNNECMFVNMNGQSDVIHLIGKYEVKGGQTVWVDGPLTSAMRNGYHICLEEINMTLPDILVRLNNIMDANNCLVLAERNNEVVKPHPEFRLFATMNPPGEYAGAKELNPAFLSRFAAVLQVEFMPETEELAIMKFYGPGIPERTLRLMQRVALKLRDAYLHEDFETIFSMRELIRWAEFAEKYLGVYSLKELGEIAFINKIMSPEQRKVAQEVFALHGIT